MIDERIKALRALMQTNGIDMYYIPTSDYHDSEYAGPYFRAREFMSGFTGSAGVMLVTQEEALLWSDGRYFIQAEKQVKNTCVKFMRQGEPEVPTPFVYIKEHLNELGVVMFDGRTVSAAFGRMVEKIVSEKNGSIVYDGDFVGQIWNERPTLGKDEIYLFEEQYCGESFKQKLAKIRNVMKQQVCDYHILTSLDDIAYVLNIRGNDIPNTPVVLSYLLITNDEVMFYVDTDKINAKVATYFDENGIVVKPYETLYGDLKQLSDGRILIDESRVNYAISQSLPAGMLRKNQTNPTVIMKAVKNDVEIENTKNAHIKDGVAFTKFMYWIKHHVKTDKIDEVSADEVLTKLRSNQAGFIETSFNTICAYQANAAMMHYSATPENKADIKPEGMLLVDSGGQYFDGTTDITRTMAMGEVKPLHKRDFTLVLKGMLALANAKFLYGCSGLNLDILARQSLWQIGIDYKCGTGHGVGHVLSVHEGPHNIRWQRTAMNAEDTPLQAGMIVTDEPGVYIEGSHGIRIENELLVCKDMANEYGQFMKFETLTFAPIDLDLIDLEVLDDQTKIWLNEYHKEVYRKISPFLEDEEKTWLKEYTWAL